MNTELLSASQVSRLADQPLSRVLAAIENGKLQPVAVHRIGKRRSYFFKPGAVNLARRIFNTPQPIA